MTTRGTTPTNAIAQSIESAVTRLVTTWRDLPQDARDTAPAAVAAAIDHLADVIDNADLAAVQALLNDAVEQGHMIQVGTDDTTGEPKYQMTEVGRRFVESMAKMRAHLDDA